MSEFSRNLLRVVLNHIETTALCRAANGECRQYQIDAERFVGLVMNGVMGGVLVFAAVFDPPSLRRIDRRQLEYGVVLGWRRRITRTPVAGQAHLDRVEKKAG